MPVRGYEPSDLRALAHLHRRAFPGSTLARLGPDVVARYLGSQLALDEVEGLVVGPVGEPVAALVGGRFGRGTSRFVRDHAGLLVASVLRHPSVLVRSRSSVARRVGASALVRRRRGPERPDRVPEGSYGVLLLAVDPDQQRRGLGRVLVDAAAGSARRRGLDRLHLTVDPTDTAARSFYEGLGFVRLDPDGDAPRAWLLGKDLGP
ncbi:MAG: GNAT family N-acetyltransferase [Acidimicrobiales bacterium]|nr:GNAT family N-acetyltransferase [Acidimicrobiales bacterium]HRW36559.1 GNAT family N-acetyltransferase [Aquihabitans sp.]